VASTGLAIVLVGVISAAWPVQAQTYTVLGRFKRTNGADPAAALIEDPSGNLLGTTDLGVGPNGYGTVFELSPSGTLKTLHSFSGLADGRYPDARLLRDAAGNLYGTTSEGGDIYDCNPGCGVVFKINSAGQFAALYRFTDGVDGAYPLAELVQDSTGNLYGTASEGGNVTNPVCLTFGKGCGVVFKIDPAGNESVLYTFSGGSDGLDPVAGLLVDAAGDLYGTASNGGSLTCSGLVPGCGVIFKIDKTGHYTVLYSFVGGAQGSYPTSTLVSDASGNLYGTTYYGGDLSCDGGVGCGTVFRLDTAGSLTTLHSFAGIPDGAFPNGLNIDDSGDLYGTTEFGGNSICVSEIPGCGTVFKLDIVGAETILYSFLGPKHHDGYHPLAGLYRDPAGTLYGTTNGSNDRFFGTVFKVAP
jgi:uncharacterized repeat protein (TIGR03803 family)